ncbi:hypothetical protein EC912_10517 [Luteibacter rhizovicinus]|uniref:Uncharacterized protein n=1 Tax=Luteibacter rhizovicinus TaxID=242606 RepID=A0A4R3YKV3_9GAMM|nr:hypothetical protein [Luteibacter rhizovicinus]TCV93157.1 hypothetical protein EC912_10517 [Luteibacter rhizovicinus]
MFQLLKEAWLGSPPIKFESAFGMNESVERLKAATSRWGTGLFSVSKERAVGTVTESRVSLYRVIPMVNNSFKPIFVGRFEHDASGVVLVGRFGMHWSVKIFLAIWMGICAFGTAASLSSSTSTLNGGVLSLSGLGMLAFGIALMWFGAWLSRNDPVWLGDLIGKALGAEKSSVTTTSGQVLAAKASADGASRFIRLATAGLSFTGLLVCASAITGILSYQGGTRGEIITHYTDVRLRFMAGVYGVFLLAMAFGVYRRSLFAWRMGFVVFASAAAFQPFFLLTMGGFGGEWTPVAIMGFFSVVVLFVWGRWWYAQREHFLE